MFRSKTDSLELLLSMLRERYGRYAIRPYGEYDDMESLGFRIAGVDATFSVLVGARVAAWHYDVQIECRPGLDYVFAEVVSLERLLEVVELIAGPLKHWP